MTSSKIASYQLLKLRIKMIFRSARLPLTGVITMNCDDVIIRSTNGHKNAFQLDEISGCHHELVHDVTVDMWFTSITFSDGQRIDVNEDMIGYWEFRARVDE